MTSLAENPLTTRIVHAVSNVYPEFQPNLITAQSFANQATTIFEREEPLPTLFSPHITHPYQRFAIVDNPKTEKQVTLRIDGMHDAEMQAFPHRLTVRLFDPRTTRVTRAIYTVGEDNVGISFDSGIVPAEDALQLRTANVMETPALTPAWYRPEFLDEVLGAMNDAQVNQELERNAVVFLTINHTKGHQIL